MASPAAAAASLWALGGLEEEAWLPWRPPWLSELQGEMEEEEEEEASRAIVSSGRTAQSQPPGRSGNKEDCRRRKASAQPPPGSLLPSLPPLRHHGAQEGQAPAEELPLPLPPQHWAPRETPAPRLHLLGQSFQARHAPHLPAFALHREEGRSPHDNMSQAEFEKAATMVQQMKAPLSEEDQLQLYGLYQQAMAGECESGSPGPDCDVRTKAKWESWNRRKGMPKEEAMKAFVAKVEELRRKHGV